METEMDVLKMISGNSAVHLAGICTIPCSLPFETLRLLSQEIVLISLTMRQLEPSKFPTNVSCPIIGFQYFLSFLLFVSYSYHVYDCSSGTIPC